MKKKNVHLISLGCPRNLVDSEILLGLIQNKGYKLTPHIKKADVIIINTCGFIEVARDESLETIKRAIEEKKSRAKIIVTGCLSQFLKNEEYAPLHPYIHFILGPGDIEAIDQALDAKEPGTCIGSTKSFLEGPETPRILSTPPHYAYVKIAEGCRKACSYCIIPHIKGPLKSKPAEQIIQEINHLLDVGVWEIMLVAQDLGDWGKDLGQNLSQLLRELLSINRPFRLRLLYLYPDEITDELISIIQSDPRILPYVDIPIQHVNDTILRAMRRKTSKKQITKIIEKLRTTIPRMILRTTLMVGFPGETDAQFEELCEFLATYPIDHAGIFAYSPEKESTSATLPNHIPDEIKQERCKQLYALQKEMVINRNQQLVGKKIPVIIDGYHPETNLLMIGRHYGQCPDVDSVVLINDYRPIKAFGEAYLVEITETNEYDLVGKALQPCTREEWS